MTKVNADIERGKENRVKEKKIKKERKYRQTTIDGSSGLATSP